MNGTHRMIVKRLPRWRHVGLLLVRFWYEYREVWKAQFLRDFLDRMLYLLAFGFGMGGLMASSHGGDYKAFLVPGIAASTGVFVMTMAMTYGVWERALTTRQWAAWLATPIRLPDILVGELLYASVRAVPSLLILLVLAYFWLGAVPSLSGALLALPVLMLANLALGALAMCITSHITRTLYFAYVNTLWTTPMFLFSGVFFDLSQAPQAMQVVAQVLPLTHVINVVRPLMLGATLDPLETTVSLLVLAGILVAGYFYAVYRFERRLMT